jgi:glycosyltransferase involved in cell wall biosynthesis
LAALEALALGAPMVSSDVGGMAEIVTDGLNGFLYPSGDPSALAGRLERLSRPEIREPMRAAARNSILEYDIGRMVERYIDLVREVTPQE